LSGVDNSLLLFYTLSREDKEDMKDLIKIIEQIEGKEGKFYWISKLQVSNSIKGRLCIHFRLI
jgi:hypothetical protein